MDLGGHPLLLEVDLRHLEFLTRDLLRLDLPVVEVPLAAGGGQVEVGLGERAFELFGLALQGEALEFDQQVAAADALAGLHQHARHRAVDPRAHDLKALDADVPCGLHDLLDTGDPDQEREGHQEDPDRDRDQDHDAADRFHDGSGPTPCRVTSSSSGPLSCLRNCSSQSRR